MRTTAPLNQIELLAEVVRGTFEGVTITTADLDAPAPSSSTSIRPSAG